MKQRQTSLLSIVVAAALTVASSTFANVTDARFSELVRAIEAACAAGGATCAAVFAAAYAEIAPLGAVSLNTAVTDAQLGSLGITGKRLVESGALSPTQSAALGAEMATMSTRITDTASAAAVSTIATAIQTDTVESLPATVEQVATSTSPS